MLGEVLSATSALQGWGDRCCWTPVASKE